MRKPTQVKCAYKAPVAFAASIPRNVGTENFAYDAMGNRTAATLFGTGSVSYTANNLNQYTAVGGSAPTYDVNGNTLTLPDRTFSYDGQSRMKSATVGFPGLPGYHTASFVYDARNRQVSRTIDGVTTYFIWDGWSLLAEYQVIGGAPQQVARYVHGPRLDEILVQARGVAPTPVYLHEDALGSTYLLTDASGAVVERYAYTAFGSVSALDASGNPVATPTTRFLYTGREWIAELGLNDHRNRFYLPSLGRWLSRDPIGENGGVNLNGYVGNGPVNAVDPLGLMIFFVPTQSTPVLGLPQAYGPARGIRTQGHQQFPGPANSAQRHQWAAQQSASQFGTTNARLLGIGNELQGLFLHDLTNLESRLNGTSPWAFQVEDLLDNEVGFDRARDQRRRDCEEQQRQRQQNPPPPPPQRPWWQNLFFPVLA